MKALKEQEAERREDQHAQPGVKRGRQGVQTCKQNINTRITV